MIELVLVEFEPNDLDGCTNSGMACYGCPHFDRCDQHFDNDES